MTIKHSEKLRQLAKEWRELAEDEAPSDTETESMLRLMMASCANQLEALASDVEVLEAEDVKNHTLQGSAKE